MVVRCFCLLEEYAPLQVVTLVDEIVHGEGIQKPGPDSAFLHVVGVFDVVAIPVSSVADDADVEYLLDGISMVVESFQRQVQPVAHAVSEPLFVDFLESDAVCAVYGVHQPYIPGEFVFCHAARCCFSKDTNILRQKVAQQLKSHILFSRRTALTSLSSLCETIVPVRMSP